MLEWLISGCGKWLFQGCGAANNLVFLKQSLQDGNLLRISHSVCFTKLFRSKYILRDYERSRNHRRFACPLKSLRLSAQLLLYIRWKNCPKLSFCVMICLMDPCADKTISKKFSPKTQNEKITHRRYCICCARLRCSNRFFCTASLLGQKTFLWCTRKK